MQRLLMLMLAVTAACTRQPAATYENSTDGTSSQVERNDVKQPAPAPVMKSKPANPANAHPCLIQDGEELRLPQMKALGTEPFWAAETQGRCVTWKTPENQAGVRLWTQVSQGPEGVVWTGALDGKGFGLSTKPSKSCSDGMSDKIYAYDARVVIGGEELRGCAEVRRQP